MQRRRLCKPVVDEIFYFDTKMVLPWRPSLYCWCWVSLTRASPSHPSLSSIMIQTRPWQCWRGIARANVSHNHLSNFPLKNITSYFIIINDFIILLIIKKMKTTYRYFGVIPAVPIAMQGLSFSSSPYFSCILFITFF